jgi:hypothetical protein
VPEVSNTSPLPQPTRIGIGGGGGGGSSHSTPQRTPHDFGVAAAQGVNENMDDVGLLTAPLESYDEQFSMLAENFFTHGKEFLRSSEDWFNTGNL